MVVIQESILSMIIIVQNKIITVEITMTKVLIIINMK